MSARQSRRVAALAFVALGAMCLEPAVARALPRGSAATPVASDATGAVWAILLPRRDQGEPRVEVLADKLAGMGISALEPLTAILFGDVPAPEINHPVHPIAIDRRVDIVVKALERLPRADVIRALRERIGDGADPERTVFGARILGKLGGPSALDALEAVAPTLDALQWQRPYVSKVFEDALVGIAKADPRHVRRLSQALTRAEVRCAPVFARALGATQMPAAVPVLLRALGRDRELDLCIMQELGKLGDRGDSSGSGADLAKLRAHGDGRDPGLQRAAAIALARLGDEASVGTLIGMLESRNALSISVAEKALEKLGGIALGRDAKAWHTWREKETAWFEAQYPVLLDDLSSDQEDRVAGAIRDLIGHKLYRHQAALAIQPLLTLGDSAVQQRACAALGLLGSARALPWLLECLDSPDQGVAREALGSLRRLSGLDLGADAEAWRIRIVSGG